MDFDLDGDERTPEREPVGSTAVGVTLLAMLTIVCATIVAVVYLLVS